MKRLTIALATLFFATIAVAANQYEERAAAEEDARFTFLKTLAGTWDATSDSEEAPKSVFEYRVSAGGSVLVEYLMKDTPMEMVTAYHMDGEDLVATHYCMLGNQPRLLASAALEEGSLSFACDGAVSNAASHDDPHIHGWMVRVDDAGGLHYEAEMIAAGEVMEKPAFALTRRK